MSANFLGLLPGEFERFRGLSRLTVPAPLRDPWARGDRGPSSQLASHAHATSA